MMTRLYFFLILGALPLSAQDSMQSGGRLNPDQTPTVAPAQPPGAAILQPGVNAPPPGAPPVLPELPAEPVKIPVMTEFTVTPGTVREIMLSRYQMRTEIKLNTPAKEDMLFHVVSSDLIKVVATDIKIIKGHDEGFGGIQITWKAVKRDCKVEFKAYDVANRDLVFHGRLYIRKVDFGPDASQQ